MSAPAGWHPQGDGRERYWDGTQWTDQYRTPGSAPAGAVKARGGFFKPWMGYVGAAVVGLLVGVGIGGANASDDGTAASASGSTSRSTSTVTTKATVTAGPTPTSTVTVKATVTAAPPAPKAAISDGTWTVGEDIKAGTYKTIDAVEEGCYWAITKAGTNGDDIISNDLPSGGHPKVTLKKGQVFESGDCGDWKRVS